MFSIKQPKEIVFGKNSAHVYKYPENSLIITSSGAKKKKLDGVFTVKKLLYF